MHNIFEYFILITVINSDECHLNVAETSDLIICDFCKKTVDQFILERHFNIIYYLLLLSRTFYVHCFAYKAIFLNALIKQALLLFKVISSIK